MQNQGKRNIKEIALYYLANLYYDREYLTWDKFEDMAIVFHQNSRLESCWNRSTRKNFEQMSLCLLEMLKIINRDSSKASWLYFENNLLPISLGKMDGRNHTSHYDKIAQLSLKMRNCIKDKAFINDYIEKEARRTKKYAKQLVKQNEIDESLNTPENDNSFNQNLSFLYHELKHGEPEDIFRQTKKVKRLLNLNNKIKKKKTKEKELENTRIQEEISAKNKPKVDKINAYFYGPEEEKANILQKANATLERMCALQEVIEDETCKMVLAQGILEFKWLICGEDTNAIQKEIDHFEDIFETSTRKSR